MAVLVECFVSAETGMEVFAVVEAAGIGVFADVGPGVQDAVAVFEIVAAGQSWVLHVEKVEGMAELVLATGKVFEFALWIVFGAESDVGNNAVPETVD